MSYTPAMPSRWAEPQAAHGGTWPVVAKDSCLGLPGREVAWVRLRASVPEKPGMPEVQLPCREKKAHRHKDDLDHVAVQSIGAGYPYGDC